MCFRPSLITEEVMEIILYSSEKNYDNFRIQLSGIVFIDHEIAGVFLKILKEEPACADDCIP